MLSDGTMIAMLPADIRRRLAGDPDNVELRNLAASYIEGTGNCCPTYAMNEAIDQWATLQFPEPVEPAPECPHCGSRLLAYDDVPLDLDPDELRCDDCDLTYGASWSRDPQRRDEVYGPGTIPGM